MHRLLIAVVVAASSLSSAQGNDVAATDAPAPNSPATAQTSADVPCSKSAGARKAEEYVQPCLEVSPATHPPCNASNSCELIIDEIKRGCAMIETNPPAFCTGYASRGARGIYMNLLGDYSVRKG